MNASTSRCCHIHLEDECQHLEDECKLLEDECQHLEDEYSHLEDEYYHVEDEYICTWEMNASTSRCFHIHLEDKCQHSKMNAITWKTNASTDHECKHLEEEPSVP